MPNPKIDVVCHYCDKPGILVNARISWNVETQKWEIDHIDEGCTCDSCGDSYAKEVPA